MAAEMVNFVPGQGGLNANAMLAADLGAYILLDVYPQYDFHNSVQAIKSLDNKNTFVVSMNSFRDKEVARYSDVMLPIASFYETSGSHINIEGVIQSFAAAVSAPSESKPAWKVLKVLADLLELSGFHYANSEQITGEISNQSHKQKIDNKEINITAKRGVSVIWQKSPYAIDVLSRHATALQATKIGQMHNALMNKATAKKEGVKEGGQYLGVPVIITEKVANNCIFVHANQSTGDKS
jgi:NADH-quinone oxidoreductase subunit G